MLLAAVDSDGVAAAGEAVRRPALSIGLALLGRMVHVPFTPALTALGGHGAVLMVDVAAGRRERVRGNGDGEPAAAAVAAAAAAVMVLARVS